MYSLGMFIVLLDAVTYSKELTVAEFMSLFSLVQSVASQMGGVSTFLGGSHTSAATCRVVLIQHSPRSRALTHLDLAVSLDSALSVSEPMFAALTEAGKARRHALHGN